MTGWQPIETAEKTGLLLLLCGETIPGRPQLYVGDFLPGDGCEEMGYREFAKYGGWLIWDSVDNFFVIDVSEPTHWQLYQPPEPPQS